MRKCYFSNLKLISFKAGKDLEGKGQREESRGGEISLAQYLSVRRITDGMLH